jgi:hypothetical protein
MLDPFHRWRTCACYLEEMLSARGVDISHRNIECSGRKKG